MAPLGMALGSTLLKSGIGMATDAMKPPEGGDSGFNLGGFGDKLSIQPMDRSSVASPSSGFNFGNFFSSLGNSAASSGLGMLTNMFSSPQSSPMDVGMSTPPLLATLRPKGY